jgi:hypothetical protein
MSARVAWSSGGEATIESVDDKAIVLRSSVPWPPGSRPEGVLAGEAGDGPAPARVRVKVHACRKQPEGDYRIEGRPIDMARAVRERIAAGD